MPKIFLNTLDKYGELPLLDGLFLGWVQTSPPYRSYFVASNEDSIAILGKPRTGKTSGILLPQAMTWAGSLISVSTKPDVLRATRGRRLEIAALRRHGDVYVYAPTELDIEIDGVRTIHWSPISGCQDPKICEQRAQKLLGMEPEDSKDAFFRQAASTVLRGYFHAAALQGLGMSEVKAWFDNWDVDDADKILRNHVNDSPSAIEYANALRGIRKQAEETKSGTFGTVSQALKAITSSAAVLANCEHNDFDIDRFLLTGSSLYIVSPEDTQNIVASLVAGLIEAIVSRAYTLARQQGDRLDPGLLLLLDEVSAIAPLPSLPQIMAQGASQGVLCVWASQTISQIKARWGEKWAGAIWGASSQKLIFGGLDDAELLEQTSQLFGEYDRYVSAHGHVVLDIMAGLSGHASPPHLKSEKHLPVKQIYNLPPGSARLIASTPQGPQTTVVGAPPAGLIPPFAQNIQAEANMQKTLKSGYGLTPDDLREQAIANAVFQNIPESEQRRFRKEEAELAAQITKFQSLSLEKQLAQLSEDPAFAREVQAQRTLAAQSVQQQIGFKRKLFSMFSEGRLPHFTYTVVERNAVAQRRRLERKPQPYRMRPRSPS